MSSGPMHDAYLISALCFVWIRFRPTNIMFLYFFSNNLPAQAGTEKRNLGALCFRMDILISGLDVFYSF